MEAKRPTIDWLMIALVMLVVLSPVFAMAVADWTNGLGVLWAFAVVGMISGLVISISLFRGLAAHGLNLIYGLTWVGYLLATPIPRELWSDKIIDLCRRVGAWFMVVARGGTGRDELIFILLLGLLFWWVGYVAVWNTVRHQRVWRALLPPGIVLLINVYYYPGGKLTPYLMLYLLCALLIVARSYTVLQERRWQSEHISYDSEVRFDLLRSGLVLAVAAILVAWVAPAAASSETALELWRQVEGPWRRVEDDFSRMFATLRSQTPVYGNPFGRTLTLRGPRTLTDTPVLQVQAPADRRFYWRGVVYDHYTGAGWINTDSNTIQMGVWNEPSWVAYNAREEITQTFVLLLPVDTLIFAAPQPEALNIPVRADVQTLPNGAAELSQLISTKSLIKGASYTVVSAVSIADVDTLRSAGTDYPAWVREHYLQLPSGIPAFVRSQAQSIAGNLATPYDKASAIEAWLRANVTYDDQTPAPPPDQDGVAYLLTIRRGYCDYYASAMAVMLRSLGIPARVAVGYAQGRYDPADSAYHVTEKDSHSWTEVYFPKYGWVEFEPTASQPSIDRPKPQITTIAPTSESTASDIGTPGPRRGGREPDEGNDQLGRSGGSSLPWWYPASPWVWGLGAVVVLIAAALLAMLVFERHGLGGLSPAAQVYARLLRFSNWLRVRWRESQTAHERGAAFSAAVPEAGDLIARITDDYTREQYSLTPPEQGSGQIWQKLSPMLWLAGLRLRVQWFRRRARDFHLWWNALSRRLNRQFG